jgi:hypothetical protein
VSASAMRLIACAGALATGLLLAGAGAGIAVADPDGSTGTGTEGASAAGNVDAGSDGSGGTDAQPDGDPPTSTFGSGRDDTAAKPSDEEEKTPEAGTGGSSRTHSLSIPVLRMPTPEEVAATGWSDPSVFIGTVEVTVPSIDGILGALAQPEPEPTPGPAFRGKEEAPVVDAAGGGSDSLAANAGAPPVFEVPLVVAPSMPIPGVLAPRLPLGASAAGPPVAVGPQTAVAGARSPLIRGSLQPAAERVPNSMTPMRMTPMSGQATRIGYPRYLRNPTMGELAAVALPGVGGLMFLTFSGGVIGYRQANSVRFIRTHGAARFLR